MVEEEAIDTMVYKRGEIERITEIAVRAAALRTVEFAPLIRQMYWKLSFFKQSGH